MDAAQWPQQVAGFSRPMEELPIPIPIPNNNNNNNNNPTNINNNNSRTSTPIVGDQRRATRPQKDQNLNCPRCNSTNTKFCYYNNYSLTQPRYFCKTCRRYWTQGGSLRNVPVGGGSRKNKRSSSSSTSSSSTPSSTSSIMAAAAASNPTLSLPSKLIPDLNPPSSLSHLITASHQNPKFLEGQDLNLAFPIQGIFQPNNNENHEPINIMNVTNNNDNNNNNLSNNNNNNNNNTTNNSNNNNNNSCSSNTPISALELLRTGIASRGSLNPYVPMPMPDSNTLYPSGFPNLQDFKPNMNMFSPPGDHNSIIGSGDGNVRGGARLLFPFADMNKLASSTPTTAATTTPPPPPPHHHHHHHDQIADDHDQNKAGNDHHHHNHNHHQHHHHQGATTGYWSGMLGGGTW